MNRKKKAKKKQAMVISPGDEVKYEGLICTVIALHRGGTGWNLACSGRMFKAVPAKKIKPV